MLMTRVDVAKLSAAMAGYLGELRLIAETAANKIQQALALTFEQIECVEEILRLEEMRRTARREELERGLTPFHATWTPAWRN